MHRNVQNANETLFSPDKHVNLIGLKTFYD